MGRILASSFLFLVGLSGCAALLHHETAPIELAYHGDIPVVIVNQTGAMITAVELHRGEKDVAYGGYRDTQNIYLDLMSYTPNKRVVSDTDSRTVENRPPIEHGQSTTVHLQPGKYVVELHHQTVEMPVEITGPTRIVFYDEGPVTDEVAGYRTVTVQTLAAKEKDTAARDEAARDTSAQRDRETCKREIPDAREPASPGPAKLSGRWTCVLAGIENGTDYVQLVQLADGHITATLSGHDSSATWSGVIAGRELHFTFTGKLAGGRLRIDPGQRAMIGSASIFNGQACGHVQFTCTR